MKIIAMPSLCTSTDFGLSDSDFNKRRRNHLLGKRSLRLGEIAAGLGLYRIGTHDGGVFFVVSETYVVYYMSYTKIVKTVLGESVTQTAVWSMKTSGLPPGFVTGMMLGPLLNEYPAILSDQPQTEAGRDMWLRLLGIAMRQGHEVGLFNMPRREVHDFTHDQLIDFASDLTGKGPWSWFSMKHEGLRFFVKAK